MELVVWHSTTCTQRAVRRCVRHLGTSPSNATGTTHTLHPTQLVIATGMSGIPNIPNYPGADRFTGEQHHSSKQSRRRSPGAASVRSIGWLEQLRARHRRRFVRARCADGDHGPAQLDAYRAVRKPDDLRDGQCSIPKHAVAAGVTTEKADLLFASIPIPDHGGVPEAGPPTRSAKVDAAFYERLERAGFLLDFGDDQSGLFMKYLRRGSGYYIDVGACELVADGSIKLAHGGVAEIRERSVVLTDGTELPADLIVVRDRLRLDERLGRPP